MNALLIGRLAATEMQARTFVAARWRLLDGYAFGAWYGVGR